MSENHVALSSVRNKFVDCNENNVQKRQTGAPLTNDPLFGCIPLIRTHPKYSDTSAKVTYRTRWI